MKNLTGLEVTKSLKALEARQDLGFEVEVEAEIDTTEHAKGFINFMNVGWDYEFKGEMIHLVLNDTETHFDHVLGMSGEEMEAQAHDVQVQMEDILEIGTSVTIK